MLLYTFATTLIHMFTFAMTVLSASPLLIWAATSQAVVFHDDPLTVLPSGRVTVIGVDS